MKVLRSLLAVVSCCAAVVATTGAARADEPVGGAIAVTAVDKDTGRPIKNLCVFVDRGWVSRQKCETTTNGRIVIDELSDSEGDVVRAWGPDGLYRRGETVSGPVVWGQTTEVRILLDPAAPIATTVIDSVTKQPVAGACVLALPLTPSLASLSPNGCEPRSISDAAGRAVVPDLPAGTFTLLVTPPSSSSYGMQWVGKTGGVGTQYSARQVKTAIRRITSVPPIGLDRSGTLTAAAGSWSGCVSVLPVVPNLAVGSGCTTQSSRLATIGKLGPYAWPMQIRGTSGTIEDVRDAWLWSGDTASRRQAGLIQVQPALTTHVDITMSQGGKLTGRLLDTTGNPIEEQVELTPYNATTGDQAGPSTTSWMGTFTLSGLGTQDIKLRIGSTWFGGPTFATATSVPVVIGQTTTHDITR